MHAVSLCCKTEYVGDVNAAGLNPEYVSKLTKLFLLGLDDAPHFLQLLVLHCQQQLSVSECGFLRQTDFCQFLV